jgi:hypothetical protein
LEFDTGIVRGRERKGVRRIARRGERKGRREKAGTMAIFITIGGDIKVFP